MASASVVFSIAYSLASPNPTRPAIPPSSDSDSRPPAIATLPINSEPCRMGASVNVLAVCS